VTAEKRRAPIENADDLARRAAVLLAAEHPAVVPQVEAELQTQGASQEPKRFDGGLVSIGGLLVAVASLAYTIWRDRQKEKRLAPDALKRRVRIELDDRGYPDTTQRAQVIEAVVRAVEDAER
jgi:hypothetical protein